MTSHLHSNEPNILHYEAAIRKYQQNNLLNAHIVVAIANNIIFEKKIGFANIESQRPFLADLEFPIASISKQFTCAAILLLKEENKLNLQEPIIQYLPKGHPLWKNKEPAWAKEITIHHLLTHSSGILSYTEEELPSLEDINEGEVEAAIISFIKEKPLHFKPGTQFEYNNTGFLLLGKIIEEISDEHNFSHFLKNRIFIPSGMKNSYLPTITQEKQNAKQLNQNNQYLTLYTAELGNKHQQPMPMLPSRFHAPYRGGAAIISTMSDLLMWHQSLYHGKLLSEASLNLMISSHIESNFSYLSRIHHGYGLFIDKDKNQQIVFKHGGWIEGVRTELNYNPKTTKTVVILSNLSPNENQAESIQKEQAKLLHDLADELLN